MQKALLETAHENNLDPQDLSKKVGTTDTVKKAKKGAFLPYKGMMAPWGINLDGDPKKKKKVDPNVYANDEPGNLLPDAPASDPVTNDPTRSDRNNNPGNIRMPKSQKYKDLLSNNGQIPLTTDKDGFLIFPDKATGQTAMQNLLGSDLYKNMTVKDALTKWTGGHPYDLSGLGDLAGKTVSDLNPDQLAKVTGTVMPQGEGTRYGAPTGGGQGSVPLPGGSYQAPPDATLPNIPLTPDAPKPTPAGATPPPLGDVNYTPRGPMPSNVQGLDLNQILPELYGYATNREVPVALQKYNPQMYVPYQYSFQDQLNDNQANFNQSTRQFGNNPTLVSSLAASKYSADNDVRAKEFRTNQEIQADTINKNIGLNNDAQLRNLQLADTQFVRQSEARSRTKEINQAIMNSIANKYQQNQLNNKRLAAYENLYDYRFNDTNKDGIPDQANYEGPDASLNMGGGKNTTGVDPNARVIQRLLHGGVTQRVVTPSQQDIQLKDNSI